MFKTFLHAILLLYCFSITAQELKVESNFSKGTEDWTGGFADFPVGEEVFYELAWGWENLPTPIDHHQKGLYISGNNHSDDLFMYFKKKITGLKPNHTYQLQFDVTLATNIPVGQIGIGGSPGESIFVKVGGSSKEPLAIDRNNFYILNLDKGEQANSGAEGVVIGHLANPNVDPTHPTYQLKHLTNSSPVLIETDNEGTLWIFVGTDSGFEGTTKFYLISLSLSFI